MKSGTKRPRRKQSLGLRTGHGHKAPGGFAERPPDIGKEDKRWRYLFICLQVF